MRSVNINNIKGDNHSGLNDSTPKSLASLLPSLQNTTILATVKSTSNNNGTVISTKLGDFLLPKEIKLENDSVIRLKLNLIEGDLSKIIELYDNNETVKLENIVENNEKVQINTQIYYNDLVDKKNIDSDITATVKYINLSNINKESALFSELQKLLNKKNIKENIETKITQSENNKEIANILIKDLKIQKHDNYHNNEKLFGEICDEEQQLMRTNFGLLKLNNSNFKLGTKLTFQISQIENHSVFWDLRPNVTEMLSNLQDNKYSIMEYLFFNKNDNAPNNKITQRNDISNNKNDVNINSNNIEYKNEKENNDLKNDFFYKKELLRNITDNFNNVKKILLNNVATENNEIKNLPFLYDNKIYHYKAKLQKETNKISRFSIELDTENFGKTIIEGLIKYSNFANNVEELEIIIKTSENIDNIINSNIKNIFANYMYNLSIKGDIKFDLIQ